MLKRIVALVMIIALALHHKRDRYIINLWKSGLGKQLVMKADNKQISELSIFTPKETDHST